MPLPLTVSCFSKIQIGFTFLVLAHLGSPGRGQLNGCVCVFYVMAPLAQDLLSAPASEACIERVFSVCEGQTAAKRNRLTKSLEKTIMLKMNLKYNE